jgi:hypothetical protein
MVLLTNNDLRVRAGGIQYVQVECELDVQALVVLKKTGKGG